VAGTHSPVVVEVPAPLQLREHQRAVQIVVHGERVPRLTRTRQASQRSAIHEP
jgi:hypothetical protein